MDSSQMTMVENIGKGLLTLVSIAFPPAAPFIAIAEELAPALIAAQPFIVNAVQSGQSAIEAGEAASPGFKDLLAKMIGVNAETATVASEQSVRRALKLPPATQQQISDWGWDDRWRNDANSGG